MKYPNYLFEYIEDNKRLRDLVETYAAQCDTLRAELADYDDESTELCGDLAQARHEASVAEAAIARVREICADPPVPSRMLIPLIRAAIEGGTNGQEGNRLHPEND